MNIQRKQQGFTLIELMIVIAIVGILAAIALPAYQDYTVRAKVSEAMVSLAESKTTIAEYFSANNRVPASAAVAGINDSPDTEIVASIIYSSTGGPMLTAIVTAATIPGASTIHSFQLSGLTTSDSRILWTCKPGVSVNSSVVMPTKYLPANCRG